MQNAELGQLCAPKISAQIKSANPAPRKKRSGTQALSRILRQRIFLWCPLHEFNGIVSPSFSQFLFDHTLSTSSHRKWNSSGRCCCNLWVVSIVVSNNFWEPVPTNQSVYICALMKFQHVHHHTQHHFLSLLEGSLNVSTNSGQPIQTCWDTGTQIDLDQKVGQQLGSKHTRNQFRHQTALLSRTSSLFMHLIPRLELTIWPQSYTHIHTPIGACCKTPLKEVEDSTWQTSVLSCRQTQQPRGVQTCHGEVSL